MMAVQTQDARIMSMFQSFKAEMDEQQERRERIVKASRDITANSKKMIFSLQRVRGLKQDLTPEITQDLSTRTKTITSSFASIAKDITGPKFWRFERSISGGIQEYIEALSFKHYLLNGEVISLAQVQDVITSGSGSGSGSGTDGDDDQKKEEEMNVQGQVHVTDSDYALGLLDLTGELMRFAITSLSLPSSPFHPTKSTNNKNENTSSSSHSSTSAISQAGSTSTLILRDLQRLNLLFSSSLSPSKDGSNDNILGKGRDFAGKLRVLGESVDKVENAVCSMIIRGSERPPGWTPDDLAGGGDRMDES